MPNMPNPTPSLEHFYNLLRKLMQQNSSNSNNTGLIVFASTLGFFSLILSFWMTLALVKMTSPPPQIEEVPKVMTNQGV